MTKEPVQFRRAQRQDLGAIIGLLADDRLGMKRERYSEAIGSEYVEAFDAISSDANQLMAVAELSGEVIGYMQISFILGLSRRGAWRGQLESVRIALHLRGRGIGEQFFRWAIEQCRARNCRLVQLTTDKKRREALRFYERLGFVPSHHGMKLEL